MKIFKLSLIATSFLLIGCGGGGGSSAPALTDVKTVDDAKTSYKAMSSFKTMDITEVSDGYSKLVQKTESVECYNGGSASRYVSDDTKTIKVSYDNCKETGELYINGSVEIYSEDKNHIVMTFSNYTSKDVGGEEYANIVIKLGEVNDVITVEFDGVINQTTKSNEVNNISFNNMVLTEKDTSNESWSTIDGGVNLKSKCVTGNYQFTTKEKLVEAKDGTNTIKSGILDINGATYTFYDDSVTVKTASEERTITQRELAEESTSTSCN